VAVLAGVGEEISLNDINHHVDTRHETSRHALQLKISHGNYPVMISIETIMNLSIKI